MIVTKIVFKIILNAIFHYNHQIPQSLFSQIQKITPESFYHQNSSNNNFKKPTKIKNFIFIYIEKNKLNVSHTHDQNLKSIFPPLSIIIQTNFIQRSYSFQDNYNIQYCFSQRSNSTSIFFSSASHIIK